MHLDRRRIDEQFRGWTVSRRQSMKEARPDTFGRPSLRAIVERLPGAIDGRGIFPPAARYQHVHNATDDPAIINPRLSPEYPAADAA